MYFSVLKAQLSLLTSTTTCVTISSRALDVAILNLVKKRESSSRFCLLRPVETTQRESASMSSSSSSTRSEFCDETKRAWIEFRSLKGEAIANDVDVTLFVLAGDDVDVTLFVLAGDDVFAAGVIGAGSRRFFIDDLGARL